MSLTLSISCAAMNGVDPTIIARAEELGFFIARGENLVAACSGISVHEDEELQYAVGSNQTCFRTLNF